MTRRVSEALKFPITLIFLFACFDPQIKLILNQSFTTEVSEWISAITSTNSIRAQ